MVGLLIQSRVTADNGDYTGADMRFSAHRMLVRLQSRSKSLRTREFAAII